MNCLKPLVCWLGLLFAAIHRYDRFPQVEDEEVVDLLARHQRAESATAA